MAEINGCCEGPHEGQMARATTLRPCEDDTIRAGNKPDAFGPQEWTGRGMDHVGSWPRELAVSTRDLARFERAAVGSELRRVELRKPINAFCRQAGLPPPYRVIAEKGPTLR